MGLEAYYSKHKESTNSIYVNSLKKVKLPFHFTSLFLLQSGNGRWQIGSRKQLFSWYNAIAIVHEKGWRVLKRMMQFGRGGGFAGLVAAGACF